MLPEQDAPTPTDSGNEAESPQSILDRRLAEIRSRQAPAAASAEPGTPATAPASIPAATDAESPEAAATAESAAHVPAQAAAAAAPIHSAGEARAVAHYGAPTPPAPVASTPDPTSPPLQEAAPPTPAEAEPPHVTPVVEVSATQSVEAALEAAPTVGSLPTSSDAAASTDEDEEYVPEPGAPDFATLSLPEQAAHLLSLLQRPDARQNRKQIFELHRLYDTALQAERTAARQRFTAEGGPAEEFSYAGPAGQAELAKALQEFRDNRARDAKAEDEQRTKNLAHKQQLLTQLRQLVESAETKDSSARIKALQNDWKATGPVPQKEAQELWNSYHALLDIYYNNRGLFFEMKELDRRRNLEAKEALIARAEALQQQPSINKALQELRQLHEEWKHIGPVPNEQRETLWQRFLQASEQVHDRKKEFLTARQTQENTNLERKTALLDQLRPYAEFQTERVNEWRTKTDELQKLKEAWDAAGLVPRDKAEAMNKQFWGAYKGFFQRKNQFFKALDEEKNANLKRKLDLCEQAEAALQNPNWEETRETVIRLQKEWKLIGRVPEKQSDKVWNRFRTACDAFFDRKKEESRQREHQAQQLGQEQAQHLSQIAEVVAALSPDQPGTVEGFQELVQAWRAFDGAARHADRAEEKFQSLMAKYLDKVPGLPASERQDLLLALQVERLKAGPDAQQHLYKKEQALRREINELENDISTLKTNLEFFARSKNANQLREEYQGRITEAQAQIDGLKKQLRLIRS
ncbi:hypothetical protein HNQ93_002459 [Hymenobacter luteus]|uniref:DUF349 domain-containing protein n=2 Tax=Hymenobacter TaxID=89966 RepID=A0A7W9T347_9BACT|nr:MULTISPECIES: DUF349 domain-containing protein [Hymenobacter]MBB4601972.1 hypothetical protein [Hymenobacter latericoloratus]MBB6059599.1 hypothetical protein [Hymenobacter luteus]